MFYSGLVAHPIRPDFITGCEGCEGMVYVDRRWEYKYSEKRRRMTWQLQGGYNSLRDNDYKTGDHGRCRRIQSRVYYGNNYCGVVRGGEVNLDNLTGGERASINYLTGKSRKNMLMKLDRMSCVFKPQYLLTLTYPRYYTKNGRQIKKDLQELFYYLRGISARHISYDPDILFFWKMEFQDRGAPHFHILVQSSLEKDVLLDLILQKWKKITWNIYDVCVDLDYVRDDFASKIYVSIHFSKDSQNKRPLDFDQPGRYWGILGNDRVEKMIAAYEEDHNITDSVWLDSRTRAVCQTGVLNSVQNITPYTAASYGTAAFLHEESSRYFVNPCGSRGGVCPGTGLYRFG